MLLIVPVPVPLHPVPSVPPPLTIDQLHVTLSLFGSKAEAVKVVVVVPVGIKAGTLILVIIGAAGADFIVVLPLALNG